MKRLIDYHLMRWKHDRYRKPLLLRGARQVGKTFCVRELGKSFTDYVEINFEFHQEAFAVFEKNLEPERILLELSLIARKTIKPGQTLLFLDEIQVAPRAIIALRYFYEMMPELHVIAAGSLIDFAIQQVGVPVGRVQSLYLYPLSFIEFLAGIGEQHLIKTILTHDHQQEISLIAHNRLLALLAEYLVFGGLPQAVKQWKETKDPLSCNKVHSMLLDFYRQDFSKYARTKQVKYVELLFKQVPIQLSKKFKYSLIEGEYRKRELAPALDLLETAGIVHKVFYSAGQGIPLGAQIDLQDYKTIFFDVGLCQTSLDLDIAGWFLDPLTQFVNKGALVEAFVGQEIIAYSNPSRQKQLYYWHKESRSEAAEIDYLLQKKESIIPVEVKSGSGKTLKSLQGFLATHATSPYGIRFSTNNYSEYQCIRSFPLYAIAPVISENDSEVSDALHSLISSDS
jgi:predicted AAA+ superfamily ATPase